MESRFWDASPTLFGYYDQTSGNGASPTGKSFNATVDAVTTHMLGLYLMTGDTVYLARLRKLADNMVNRLAASAATQATGFVEGYDTNWGAGSVQHDDDHGACAEDRMVPRTARSVPQGPGPVGRVPSSSSRRFCKRDMITRTAGRTRTMIG